MKRFKKFGKRFLAVALIAMSVFAVALPAAMAATYTIGAPAGKSGPATTRSQPNSTSVSYGTLGTDSTVDISDPTVTAGYVKVKILTSKNGTYTMGKAPNNEAYILAEWVKGFSGGGTSPTNPPSGGDPTNPGYVNITSGYLYLRKTPDANGTVLAQMYRHEKVLYEAYNSSWHRVKYGSIIGYASATNNYIMPGNPPGTTDPGSGSHASKYGAGFTGVVISDDGNVHIRKDPTSSSQSLLKVPQHHTVTYYVQGDTGNVAWIPVNKNGVDGWMASQYLRDGSNLNIAPLNCTVCGRGLTAVTPKSNGTVYRQGVATDEYHMGCGYPPLAINQYLYKDAYKCSRSADPIQYQLQFKYEYSCCRRPYTGIVNNP